MMVVPFEPCDGCQSHKRYDPSLSSTQKEQTCGSGGQSCARSGSSCSGGKCHFSISYSEGSSLAVGDDAVWRETGRRVACFVR